MNQKFEWILLPQNNRLEDDLVAKTNINPILARVLIARGYNTVDKANEFINPSFGNFHNYTLLNDLLKARDRLVLACRKGERIAIVGHDDVDGITSTAIVMRTLETLGADCFYYLPHRFEDDYGLTPELVKKLRAKGATIILTVDNGITSVKGAEYCKELEMDLIITDHHQLPSELPQAFAVVNPLIGGYPFRVLSGAGVALKLSMAILDILGDEKLKEELFPRLFSLAALGTISDRVPIINENRIIVSKGLRYLENEEDPLYEAIHPKRTMLNVDCVVKNWLPVLSASRSIEGESPVCEIFLSKDIELIMFYRDQLNSDMKKWRERASQDLDRIFTNIDIKDATNKGYLVHFDENIALENSSYCASHFRDNYDVIALIISEMNGILFGESRAPEGPNLVNILASCSEYLRDFGGHPQAAGFSLEKQNLSEFLIALEKYLPVASGQIVNGRKRTIDAIARPGELNGYTFNALQKIEPVGEKNPVPIFAIDKGLKLAERNPFAGDYLLSEQGLTIRWMLENRPSPGDTLPFIVFYLSHSEQKGTFLDVIDTIESVENAS
jgi:single-stranded-DNA-specific exonuclease